MPELNKEMKNTTKNNTAVDSDKGKEFLSKFAFDITARYRASDDFSPILERDSETRDLLSIIVQKFKNNCILVGEAGTGKTAIVEGLAQALALGIVPPSLKGFSLWELDIPSLSSKDESDGGYRYRVKKIIEEVENDGKIILFVDETHVILNKKSELDVGDLLKPALARGKLRMIGSTTDIEYHTYIERDKALVRRFQRVTVNELKRDSTIRILKSRKRSLEVFHGVTVDNKAIEAAVDLGIRYLPSRRNPDKSIDILDKACAMTRLEIDAMPKDLVLLQGEIFVLEKDYELETDPEIRSELESELNFKKPFFEKQVKIWEVQKEALEFLRKKRSQLLQLENQLATEESKGEHADQSRISKLAKSIAQFEVDLEKFKDTYYNQPNLMIKDVVDSGQIQKTIEATTGIPVSEIGKSEIERLRSMSSKLSKRVIGQKHAIEAVTYAIKRSRLGISNPKQPIGSFIFLGPSGVGKALRASELIPTPDRGFVPLYKLKVGDRVFDRTGKPTTIEGVFPQGQRNFFSVNISDGRSLPADKEHIFGVVRSNSSNYSDIENLTVAEILEEQDKDPNAKFFIPNNGAVEFDDGTMKDVESLYFAIGSRTEHITKALKTTNLSQRRDIIRGAFDHYGTFDENNPEKLLFIANEKEQLVSDVREMLFSMGISTKQLDKFTLEVFYESREQVFDLFGKKVKKDEVFVKIPRVSPYRDKVKFLEITSIVPELNSEEAICILVDNEEHLFLAGTNYVVTHNTELVKAIAEVMFGDEGAMKRFDCGELQAPSSVARLIGSPPGESNDLDAGGEMTEFIKKHPYSVLLFDECEKGFPGIWDTLLSVLDEGEVADARGEVVNFRNTIIILTSNIASQMILRNGDPESGELPKNIMEQIVSQLKNHDPERGGKGFRPEFVNRLSGIITFYKLQRHQLEMIANLKLRSLAKRLEESRNIKLVFSEKTHEVFREAEPPELDVAWLLSSPWYLSNQNLDLGGRPVERNIVSEIENRLTDLLLEESVPDGSYIYIQAGYGTGLKYYKDRDGNTRPVSPVFLMTQISEDEYKTLSEKDPVAHLFDKN